MSLLRLPAHHPTSASDNLLNNKENNATSDSPPPAGDAVAWGSSQCNNLALAKVSLAGKGLLDRTGPACHTPAHDRGHTGIHLRRRSLSGNRTGSQSARARTLVLCGGVADRRTGPCERNAARLW